MLLMMRSKSGHGHGHGHGHVVVVLFLFMFLQLSFATDTYLGLWEHRHCNMSTCELDSVTNTSCTNGTVLSEYCEQGYSACCQSGSSCSHGYGGCVDLQSSGCDSGPAVLGVCEDWEGGAPFDVFCCDEDFSPDEFNNDRDTLLTELFIVIICCTVYLVVVYCVGSFFEKDDYWAFDKSVGFNCCSGVGGAVTLMVFTIIVHQEYGLSLFVTLAYVLFPLFVFSGIFAVSAFRIVPVGFFLAGLLLLYYEVKSQDAMQYDINTTPQLPTKIPSSVPSSGPTLLAVISDTYLGLWEHRHCNMSTCELDSVTHTSCTNGTVLSEYCEPGYSACCQSGSSCSHGYGGCVNLQSSGCDSGPAVLGVCEDWEGGAPFDVFCCDEDFSPDEFNNDRDTLLTELFIVIICCTVYLVVVYCVGSFFEKDDYWAFDKSVGFNCCSGVGGAVTLMVFTIIVHQEYGLSLFVTLAYVLFPLFIFSGIFAVSAFRIVPVGFFLAGLLLLYYEVKSQDAMQYDIYATPQFTTSLPSSVPSSGPTRLNNDTHNYLGMWEHRHCNMSTCELDSVTNTSCTNGTVLSEYCEPGYSACCQSGSSCSHGYGGCVDLQSSGCDSGPAVLGVCEDWEGGAPFDVFCCDEDFSPDEFNNDRDTLLTELFIVIVCCTVYLVVVYCMGTFFEEDRVWSYDTSVGFNCCSGVGGAATLMVFTVIVHQEYGLSLSVTLAYVFFPLFVFSGIFAVSAFRIVPVGFFLAGLLLLYYEVKSQDAMQYDIYATPQFTTSLPSSVPSFFPSSLPSTFSPLPTSQPTMVSMYPTSQPSLSVSPTNICPLGFDRTANCEACPTGQYGDTTGCHHCDSWKWTLSSGSDSCDYYTAQRDLDPAYAITLCVVYSVLSLTCFAYYVQVTGRWLAIVSVLMITGDQVTDILYAQFSIFSDRPLLVCSVFFCLFNLVAQGVWIIAKMKYENLLILKWNEKWQVYLEEKGYGSWVLHEILKVNTMTRSIILSIILIPMDILWVCFLLLVMVVVSLSGLLCQILLLFTGMILSSTKLMSTPQVFDAFWSVWNPEFLEKNKDVVESPLIYNLLVGAEMIFENIPQITIQVSNSYYQSSWDTLTILSLCFSVIMIISVANHFRYHVIGEGLSIKDVPKYDILAEMIASFDESVEIPAIKRNVPKPVPQLNEL